MYSSLICGRFFFFFYRYFIWWKKNLVYNCVYYIDRQQYVILLYQLTKCNLDTWILLRPEEKIKYIIINAFKILFDPHYDMMVLITYNINEILK